MTFFVYKENLSAEVFIPENPILCMFFSSTLLLSGDMILYKEPQDMNTESLTGQKHFYNSLKTFSFTATLLLANRSYVRPAHNKENLCHVEPWLLSLKTWVEKSIFEKHPPVPDTSLPFLTLQHHKGMELSPPPISVL